MRGGQRVAKSVVRRVVRRGSRRLSGGGELLTETKETSKTGDDTQGSYFMQKVDVQTKEYLMIFINFHQRLSVYVKCFVM